MVKEAASSYWCQWVIICCLIKCVRLQERKSYQQSLQDLYIMWS